VVFVPLSALLLMLIGIEGAAIAWALRALIDCAGRAALAARIYPAAAETMRALAAPIVAAGVGLALAASLPSVAAALAAGSAAALAFTVLAWRALSADERAWLRFAARNPAASLRR
jgi:hypothetical protein